MAQTQLVTVAGQPFATTTTLANAQMLAAKINKYVPGAAAVQPDTLMYNPKHADALAALGIDPDAAPAPAAVQRKVKAGKRAADRAA